jgi:hypothetical protein
MASPLYNQNHPIHHNISVDNSLVMEIMDDIGHILDNIRFLG